MRKMLVIGLTGGIACGKTTIAEMLKEFAHAQIIDADKIAKVCMQVNKPAYKRVLELFGNEILDKNKKINSKSLAELVFKNKKMLNKLNAAVHPLVIAEIKKKISKSKAKIVVLDVPLLIEAELQNLCDVLVIVKASRQTQIKRLMQKGLSKQQAISRINSQIPLTEKLKIADYVIANGGSLEKTRMQVKRFLSSIGAK